jgi:transposase
MPWKECSTMDERVLFVAKVLEGHSMASVCREFGISRKTGHKIFNRYKDMGIDGLQDRSRRPCRQANQLPFQVEQTILSIKREYPNWGAAKIREKLSRVSLSPQWGAVAALPRPNRLSAVCRSGSHLRPANHKQKRPV